jgi:phosphoglycerate dehydrogenase-like enzyme
MTDVAKTFRIGISPDFHSQARGHFEPVLHRHFGDLPGAEVATLPDMTATPEAIDDFDAILALALRVTAESVSGVTRPAILARWGVGYDLIDTDALSAAAIPLCITPAGVRRPVAEAELTMIFALAKNLFALDRMARAGRWRQDMKGLAFDIRGSVLGSVGCGNIARELFRLARPLGFARLVACDPNVQPDEVAESGIELVSLEQVLSESDFVTVNALLTGKTANLIGETQLRSMKPTSFLINLARGRIVDYAALDLALRERWIAGAGIDVFPEEPPPPNDPLFSLDNVIVTPHALAWTDGIMRGNGDEACKHILSVMHGRIPGDVVNREVLSDPRFLAKLERYR